MNSFARCLLSAFFGLMALESPVGLSGQADQAAVDSAVIELARGRSWHAARLLRAQPDLSEFTPQNVLMLAQAEAGFRDDQGVAEVLRGRSWLPMLADGEGLYLLGVAESKLGEATEAARLLRLFEENSPDEGRRAVARSRLARIQAEDGLFAEAIATLERMAEDPAALRSWSALEVARIAARYPDVSGVRGASELAQGEPALRMWALEAEALVHQGDSLMAEAVYAARMGTLGASSRQGWAAMSLGRLQMARGEDDDARVSFEASLEAFPRGTSGVRASMGLLQLGVSDADEALRVARIIRAGGGDARPSIEAYERYFALIGDSANPADRFAWASQLAGVGRHEDAVVAFRELEKTDDPAMELRVLDTWVDVRRSQGRRDAARTVQGWILERFPESAPAAEIYFFRGDDLHDRGALVEARAQYVRALETGPHAIAGLAWMRAAQISADGGRSLEAAELYERYLEQYPDGRRRNQAAYWAGRSRAALGDTATARGQWESILSRSPTSYYALLAARELGREFEVAVPTTPDRLAASQELQAHLALLDMFVQAELDEAADWWIARVRERTETVGDRLALAEELIGRGYTVEGIRTGQALVSAGEPLDRRLMEIIYPFPFRDVIMAEAAERNVDPYLLAGLIRQESAFDADVVSRAGAVGLMQVMPATGGELARTERIRGFTSESLETAEINVHLGVNFWVDLKRAFAGSHLPLRLSAYNAGPTRARRWRQLPENDDPLRFTERIPFEETRGYVKSVSRNAALYKALYGEARPAPAVGAGTR
jgi:peptidoglycan lytic transglycosylase